MYLIVRYNFTKENIVGLSYILEILYNSNLSRKMLLSSLQHIRRNSSKPRYLIARGNNSPYLNHPISLGVEKLEISDIISLKSMIKFPFYLRNLERLVVSCRTLEDLSPIAHMTSLRKITIIDAQIKDLSPLSQLTNLEEIYLDNNQISSLEPLRSLKKLQLLRLSNNDIEDLSPLYHLPKLRYLSISKNPTNRWQILGLRLGSVDVDY